jgi:hypothetical protein
MNRSTRALHTGPLKGLANHVEVPGPGLTNDGDGRRIAAPRQSLRRFRDGHINCVRALRAAKDQDPNVVCVNGCVINMQKLLSNRVAADESLAAEERGRRVVRHRRRFNQRREQADW